MDAFSGVSEFVRITADKEHDRKFLGLLPTCEIMTYSMSACIEL